MHTERSSYDAGTTQRTADRINNSRHHSLSDESVSDNARDFSARHSESDVYSDFFRTLQNDQHTRVRGSPHTYFDESAVVTSVIHSVIVCSTIGEIVSSIVWYSLRPPVVQD